MTRHIYTSVTRDGTPVTVTAGWDRPLQNYFLQIEENGDGDGKHEFNSLAYSQTQTRSFDPFFKELCSRGILVPVGFVEELELDKAQDIGNKVKNWGDLNVDDFPKFETHVYATVRVKVIGARVSSSPDVLADVVTEAVCASPGSWFTPVHGTLKLGDYGSADIEAVEFAEGVMGTMVDEYDANDNVVHEHQYDHVGEKLQLCNSGLTRREELLIALAQKLSNVPADPDEFVQNGFVSEVLRLAEQARELIPSRSPAPRQAQMPQRA